MKLELQSDMHVSTVDVDDESCNGDCHSELDISDLEIVHVTTKFLTTDAADRHECEEEEASARDYTMPVDRGWAWVVLFASTVVYIIVVGYMKCRGILFLEWQHRFRSSASATSVINLLQNSSCSISSLFVMTLGMRYMSCRTAVMVGAALGGSVYLVTAFATDIRIVYLSDGLLYGVAIAFIIPPVITMINAYFERYRGLANSVSVSGVGIGGLTLAPVFTKLFAYYGYTGTFMIASGLLFNVVVCGALLRPPESYRGYRGRTEKKDNSVDGTEKPRDSETYDIRYESSLPECEPEPLDREEQNANDATYNASLCSNTSDVSSKLYIKFSTKVLFSTKNTSTDDKCDGDIVQLNGSPTQSQKPSASTEKSTPNRTDENSDGIIASVGSRVRSLQKHIFNLVSTALQFRLLKNPVFLYYLVMTAFLCSGNSVVGDFLAPRAEEMNVDKDRIAILLSVSCGLDVFSKIIIGYISDRKWLRRSTLVALAAALFGIASHLMYFWRTFETLLVYAVAIGLLQGIYFSQYPALIIEHLSLGELKGALGFTFLLQGFSTGASHPLAGMLRDVTGSYVATYHFMGSLLLVGALLCLCLPVVHRWNNRRHKHTPDHDTSSNPEKV